MNTKLNEEAVKLADNGTSKLNAINFNKRFYEHDATLWKTEKEHTDLIANCLGWTEVYNWTLDRIDEIETFAKEVVLAYTASNTLKNIPQKNYNLAQREF